MPPSPVPPVSSGSGSASSSDNSNVVACSGASLLDKGDDADYSCDEHDGERGHDDRGQDKDRGWHGRKDHCRLHKKVELYAMHEFEKRLDMDHEHHDDECDARKHDRDDKHKCGACGFCFGDDDDVRVHVQRLCGEPSKSKLHLEDAKHPILTIEAKRPDDDDVKIVKDRCARGDHEAAAPLKKYPSTVIASFDLNDVDIRGPKFGEFMHLALDPIRHKCDNDDKWKDMVFTAYICEDDDGHKKCSDKDDDHQLAVRQPVFQADHFPKELIFDVWGR